MKKQAARSLVAAILLVGCCVPVAYYFFYSFGNLPIVLRCIAAFLITAVLFAGVYHLRGYVLYMPRAAAWASAILSIGGMVMVGTRADVFPAPGNVSIEQPGTPAKFIPASLNPAWGKSFQVYKLDLRELAGRTLVATFPVAVNRIIVNLTADPGSRQVLRQDDGSALTLNLVTGSDVEPHRRITQGVGALAERRWHIHTVKAVGETIRWDVSVTGQIAAHNPTIWFAIQVKDRNGWVFAIGKILLVGLAVWVVAVTALLSLVVWRRRLQVQCEISRKFGPRYWVWIIPVLAFIGVLGGLVYWSSSKTRYIFFWDYRNYWAQTELTFQTMAAGNWSQILDSFIASYSANYSMLPTILPALLCFVIGYPGRVDYALLITVVYAVPAYLLVAYCGRELVRPAKYVGAASWAWATFVILICVPSSLGVVLFMMPDIGGVAITAAALIMANRLLRHLRKNVAGALSPAGAVAALGLGLTLSLMFLFRRWYVFASVGIGMAVIILSGIYWWRHRADDGPFSRCISGFGLIAVAALPLLVPVVVDWAANLGAHDYSTLYASYRWGAWADFDFLREAMGLAVPLLVIVFLCGSVWLGWDRWFLGLLTISTAVAAMSFYHVQSPALHHYYLLMPLLGTGVAAGFQYLWSRFGVSLTAAGAFGIAILGVGVTMANDAPDVTRNIFPGYGAWLPKIQPGLDGMTRLTRWLVSPSVGNLSFCLIASSLNLNESSLFESWQIVPSVPRYPFTGRMIRQAQVDSVNGAPFESIRNCEIALVASPLQMHLREGQQDNVKILWEEIAGNYGIGVHYKKMSIQFNWDDGIVIVPYRRVSDITQADYRALVARYKAMKAAEAKQS